MSTKQHVTAEEIHAILSASEIKVDTVFEKCTVVICKLPNGFVLTESSGSVSRETYDEQIGFENCMRKIADVVWKMEGYKLQDKLHDAVMPEPSKPSIILP